MPIELPVMLTEQSESWKAIFEVYEALPHGWILVGGQAVYLHAIERNAPAPRATKDADFALDIRAYPQHLNAFTGTLKDLGFESAGESLQGHQHRWLRGEAVVDVLIPRFMGEVSEKRTGVTGGTTLAAPGTQAALDRAETVEVVAGEFAGKVNRSTLLGSMIGKAAALKIMDDPGRMRHVTDFLTLASVIQLKDLRGAEYEPSARSHLANMLGSLVVHPEWMATVPEAADGVERLRMSLQG